MKVNKDKLTINDIAERFRVSITTISFILNGKASEKKISPSLVRRVEEYVKKVGYVPSSAKKRMVTIGANKVVVVVDKFMDYSLSNLLDVLRKKFEEKGFTIFIVTNSSSVDQLQSDLDFFLSQGIRLFLSLSLLEQCCVRLLLDRDANVLALHDSHVKNANTIVFNYKDAAEVVLKEVVAQGARRVGFVTTVGVSNSVDKEKLAAYMNVLDESGGDVLMKKIDVESGQSSVETELKVFLEGNQIDALFFANDSLAILSAQVVKAYSKDIAIVSFGSRILLKSIYDNIRVLSVDVVSLADFMVEDMISRSSQKLSVHTGGVKNVDFDLI